MSEITDAQKLEQSKILFANAVRTFVRTRSDKYAKLLPFQESVSELRSKKASYRTIRDLLQSVGVTVSLDAVARFCREVVEQKQVRPIKRKSPVRSLSDECPNAVRVIDQQDVRALSDATTPLRTRGPRIADPHNV